MVATTAMDLARVLQDRVHATLFQGFTCRFGNCRIRVFTCYHCCSHFWTSSKVHFHCDNMAVIQMIHTRQDKKNLSGTVRNISLIMASLNIRLQVEHVKSTNNNTDDLLSRFY